MKPTRALAAKDLVPISIARFQLGNGGVPAIRTTKRGTCAETSLSEIQSVANQTTYAIELSPMHVRLIDAALIHQVLNKTADGIVSQRRDDSRIQPEASLQTTCDVIFTAAFPDLKAARGGYASVSRIKPQHYLAETYQIPAALAFRFYFQRVLA